jgi:hypothetical protein
MSVRRTYYDAHIGEKIKADMRASVEKHIDMRVEARIEECRSELETLIRALANSWELLEQAINGKGDQIGSLLKAQRYVVEANKRATDLLKKSACFRIGGGRTA